MEDFLQGINLLKYKDTLLDNGVEDLETILEMDEKHLEQMGIPLGHKLKIMKRIKDCRREKGMEVPESRQGGERPKPSNLANNVVAAADTNTEGSPKKKTMKKVAFADEPNFMTGGVGTDNPSYKQPSPTKKAISVAAASSSLLEGEYNEAE